MDKAFNHLPDALGLGFLAEFFPPQVQAAFWTACGIIFAASLYRTLTTKRRYKLLAIMGNEITLRVWLIITVLFIALMFYFALDAVDSILAAQIKIFLTSGDGKIFIGSIILLITYGLTRIDENKLRDAVDEEAQAGGEVKKIIAQSAKENLSGGAWKKFLVIAFGIILGVGFIVSGIR